ncbi:glycosyltransferase family 4 protein [Helicobacter sp. MIT 14-3879]|uniref:glycosyltransferase family 4 protein n=1 Tax=Helicobacter sp. MIT 14-3879 TaxID=2040649 RepID=UPI000E1F6DD2|nr:MraY family glycosyltransferase [Helicobacter sp. MIT 14-3879]RDU65415.1 undecaprenyl/decaprenyl-phosphate alpha-N-acetylglucosaminyl 1-phosphate transferase [Helicobacter sp. MIT 14-3879]
MLKTYEVVFLTEVFLVCFFCAMLLCMFIIKYSKQRGILLDKDSISKPQKMHYGDIPRAGGVGIFIAIIIGLLLGIKYKYLGLLIPTTLVFLSGILEDFHNSLSPKKRLLLQIAGASSAIILFDCVIIDIGFNIPYYAGIIFSIFCIVGIINAVNIIDGFNGLAGGYSILALISIAIVSYIVGNIEILYICIITIGSILGFMMLNFPNGKIFLGDGGAYLIGFLLSFLLIKLTQNINASEYKVSAWFGLCIMIYPVFEVLFSMWRKKILRDMSAMEPDGIHFHMLLYKRITRSNYKTSILIWLLNLPFLFLGIIFFDNIVILITLICIFIMLYLYIYFRIIRFKKLKI